MKRFWLGVIFGIALGIVGSGVWLGRASREEIKNVVLPGPLKDAAKLKKEEIEQRKALLDLVTASEQPVNIYGSVILPIGIALLTGFILAATGQYINYMFWVKQKDFEQEKTKTNEMIKIYSDAAQSFTHFSQLMLLRDIAFREEQKARKQSIPAEDAAKARREYEKERLQVEPKIARLLREVSLYFGQEAQSGAEKLRRFYNDLDSTIDEEIVGEFNKLFDDLLVKLGQDIIKRTTGG